MCPYDPFEHGMVEIDHLTDELVDTLRQHNPTMTPTGEVVSDISRMAQRREESQQKLDQQIQRVSINPPSARKGILGGAANMTNGAPTQRVINWIADNMEEATVMTVTLAVIDSAPNGVFSTIGPSVPPIAGNPPVSTSAQNRPYANIYWVGGRGSPMVAQVDIGKGCQLSLAGSTVAVDVGLDAGNSGGSMNLGAWLSFFSSARPAPVTRTIYADNLPFGLTGATIYIIPPFSRKLLAVQRTFNTTATGDNVAPKASAYQIDFRDKNGTVICSIYENSNSLTTTEMPIPNDAYDIIVYNKDTNTPTANLTLRLVFELGL